MIWNYDTELFDKVETALNGFNNQNEIEVVAFMNEQLVQCNHHSV